MAAKQGYQQAHVNLGNMYATGKGDSEKNVRAYAWYSVSAYAWLSIAAAQGIAKGKQGKAMVAKVITPAQIAKA